MNHINYISKKINTQVLKGEVSWSAPSNIALVKYWGKKENQIPSNPSISFTLNQCKTNTKVIYTKKETVGFSFEVFFEGQLKEAFKPKIETFFQRIEPYISFLKDYHFKIETLNTFPHSSGIASSASGMSALALCLMSIEKDLGIDHPKEFFFEKASFLARLGSGSACRSLYPGIVSWGKHKNIPCSSNLFSSHYQNHLVHDVFKSYKDAILLVDKGEKQVSSTVGHNLMHNHPFSEQRFIQANENLSQLLSVLKNGDIDQFIKITESEALTLHAMMMTSHPYFILMKANTLKIINKIWKFRQETASKACFTLDAGANIHLLYPKTEAQSVENYIKNELSLYCKDQQFILDEVGKGPIKN